MAFGICRVEICPKNKTASSMLRAHKTCNAHVCARRMISKFYWFASLLVAIEPLAQALAAYYTCAVINLKHWRLMCGEIFATLCHSLPSREFSGEEIGRHVDLVTQRPKQTLNRWNFFEICTVLKSNNKQLTILIHKIREEWHAINTHTSG